MKHRYPTVEYLEEMYKHLKLDPTPSADTDNPTPKPSAVSD